MAETITTVSQWGAYVGVKVATWYAEHEACIKSLFDW